jgi:hypothetical protein
MRIAARNCRLCLLRIQSKYGAKFIIFEQVGWRHFRIKKLLLIPTSYYFIYEIILILMRAPPNSFAAMIHAARNETRNERSNRLERRREIKKPAIRGFFSNQNSVGFVWCPEAESNHRHEDFQSTALPTELSGRVVAGGLREACIKPAWVLRVNSGF